MSYSPFIFLFGYLVFRGYKLRDIHGQLLGVTTARLVPVYIAGADIQGHLYSLEEVEVHRGKISK